MRKRKRMSMNQVRRLLWSLGHSHARWWYAKTGHRVEAKARADSEERALRKLAYAIAFTVVRMNQRAAREREEAAAARMGRISGKLTHQPFAAVLRKGD